MYDNVRLSSVSPTILLYQIQKSLITKILKKSEFYINILVFSLE